MTRHLNMSRIVCKSVRLASLAFVVGCSSEVATTQPGAVGGQTTAEGGAGTGGGSQAVGAPGGSQSGSQASAGGNEAQGGSASGGVGTPSTGGSNATGGAVATGGSQATGGTVAGGGSQATGGTVAGGGNKSTGGTPSTGGSKTTGGSIATGGNGTTGGAQGTGGASRATGGAPNAAGGSSAATGGNTSTSDAATTISNWMNSCLKYGNPSGQTRTDIINAIIGACNAFGPPEATNLGWKMQYCWAQLIGSILKESSYNVTSINEPGSDPTVGLTQVRFSSTVHDFYTGGPRSALENMGCAFPADFATNENNSSYWSSRGGDTANTQWMQTPACNIGLGAWYYYTYATGGGDTATTQYLYQLCNGKAKDANLATGMMSHLRGPSNQWASIPGLASVPSVGQDYLNSIRTVMDCALGGTAGTDALFIKLTFNKVQYCK